MIEIRLPQPTLDRIQPYEAVINHLTLGVMFTFIGWSSWKYLSGLDELARGLQLRAMSLTYLTGMAAMDFVASLSPVIAPWHFDPLICFILLEPVRGFWLWRLARRY